MVSNKQTSAVRSSASEAIIDQGLRSYMLKVYNYMASGVLLTGFIALLFFKMSVVTSNEGQIIGLTNVQHGHHSRLWQPIHPTHRTTRS